jgi:hypothetical protein
MQSGKEISQSRLSHSIALPMMQKMRQEHYFPGNFFIIFSGDLILQTQYQQSGFERLLLPMCDAPRPEDL